MREIRPGRTGNEILLASLVGRVIPKADVAGVYLFVAYFGWRMNGIREACSRLGFNVATVTPLQAVSVVARLRYPEQPTMSDERALQIATRARRILRLVEGEGGRGVPGAVATVGD